MVMAKTGQIFDIWICLKSSNMMVTSFRIDCCADQINKKPDLIIEKHKI